MQTEPDSLTQTRSTEPLVPGQVWDAIVVGAGPAGGMSAIQLAQLGHRVLLVEAKTFPRDKVCGGCLNQRAWTILEQSGIAPHLLRAGAIRLDRMRLLCGSQRVQWPMPTMHAVSRYTMDYIIYQQAMQRGVHCMPETQARILPTESNADFITVELRQRSSQPLMVRSKVAIAADGLTHSSLGKVEQADSKIVPGSRVGVGATFDCPSCDFALGELTMAVGQSGYVGVTRVEGNRLNVAAAVCMSALRELGPANCIEQLLHKSGLPVPENWSRTEWTGTPQLTRESERWAARRLFLVGDAASYVEPFTGEGMSWALAGAVAVTQIAQQAIEHWSDDLIDQWHKAWRKKVRQHQLTCRGLAWLLRRPSMAEKVLYMAQYMPWMVRIIMRRVSGADYQKQN